MDGECAQHGLERAAVQCSTVQRSVQQCTAAAPVEDADDGPEESGARLVVEGDDDGGRGEPLLRPVPGLGGGGDGHGVLEYYQGGESEIV